MAGSKQRYVQQPQLAAHRACHLSDPLPPPRLHFTTTHHCKCFRSTHALTYGKCSCHIGKHRVQIRKLLSFANPEGGFSAPLILASLHPVHTQIITISSDQHAHTIQIKGRIKKKGCFIQSTLQNLGNSKSIIKKKRRKQISGYVHHKTAF